MHFITDQFRFWERISRFRPDIVHLNPSLDLKSFLRDGLFVLVARLRNKPVLVFFRGWQEPFEARVEGRYRWFFRGTYLHASRFIVLAQAFAGKLREWGVSVPVVQGTTAVSDKILDGFDIDAKARMFSNNEPVRLLYLARLEKDKGVLQLLDAVIQLLKKGRPVALTIAGDGEAMDEIREVKSVFPEFSDSLRLAGYVRGSEKVGILHSHHVYCFPTRYGEGMPNSVLEAMAFGLPVITCPVGGIGDFFENGKMGVLLEDNNPASIETAIESLLSDHDRLAEISRYNHAYACRHFLASTAAGMLRRQYDEVWLSETVV